MIAAMGAILLTWLILALAFIGLGRAVWRLIGARELAGGFDWVVAFWLGYVATLCFLQVWNFWLPINGYALLVVCVAGGVLLLVELRQFVCFVAAQRPAMLIALGLVSIWVADRALGPGNADDSGNYHYTVIRWANEYPAVPGLANLSAVYTYNNSSLLYAAMMNTGPWRGRGEHVTNGLLIIALFAQVLAALFRLLREGVGKTTDFFDLVLLTPAVMLTLAKDLPSPKTDLPAGVLTLVMARVALGLFYESGERRRRSIVVLGLFAGALVSLKLSAGLIALLLLGIAILVCGLNRAVIGAAVGALVLVGPWVGRNVILNGYPLYPSKLFPLPVEWRVDGHVVDLVRENVGKQSKSGMLFWLRDTMERNHLARYARLVNPPFGKDENPPGFSWVRPWFFSLPVSSLIEIVLPAGIVLIALVVLLRRKSGARELVLCVAPLVALAFWFVTAPDPRFGWPAAWMLAALLVAIAFGGFGRRAVVALVAVSILLSVPTLGFRLAVLAVQKQVKPLHQVPVQWPGPDHGFWSHPTIAFKPVTNRWGVTVNMPVDEQDAMTWGGPLPCAGWNWPPNNPDLRMREPGNLAAGFVTDRRSSK